ncbi:MAG: hypothetical protein Ta2F_10700 [Termitinemataceae bacterium]|nr:MAG: hypothetical protein Ta2F_10700 [Termitinemataceae bacterium]
MVTKKIVLKEAFRDAAEDMGTGKIWPQISTEYDRLEKIYKERAYHNFGHIEYCVQMLNDFTENKISKTVNTKTMLNDEWKQNITFALFYHDLVLGAGGQEESAKVVKTFLAGAKAERVEQIVSCILATDYAAPAADVKLTSFQKITRDIDLSILGSDASTYKNYTAKVRKEYASIPDAEFAAKRAALIDTFLKGSVYATTVFSEIFEKSAKQNLRSELDALRA